MYNAVLILHSFVRWLVIVIGIVAAVRAFRGWYGKGVWTPADDRLGMAFTMSMDIQVLLGLLLYIFFSPLTRVIFRDFGAAMANAEIRFFAADHIFLMIVALVLAHVGRAISRRAHVAAAKHRWAALFFGLALLLILVSIPWSRPLLRLG
jgi:hypothetical protein